MYFALTKILLVENRSNRYKQSKTKTKHKKTNDDAQCTWLKVFVFAQMVLGNAIFEERDSFKKEDEQNQKPLTNNYSPLLNCCKRCGNLCALFKTITFNRIDFKLLLLFR